MQFSMPPKTELFVRTALSDSFFMSRKLMSWQGVCWRFGILLSLLVILRRLPEKGRRDSWGDERGTGEKGKRVKVKTPPTQLCLTITLLPPPLPPSPLASPQSTHQPLLVILVVSYRKREEVVEEMKERGTEEKGKSVKWRNRRSVPPPPPPPPPARLYLLLQG